MYLVSETVGITSYRQIDAGDTRMSVRVSHWRRENIWSSKRLASTHSERSILEMSTFPCLCLDGNMQVNCCRE